MRRVTWTRCALLAALSVALVGCSKKPADPAAEIEKLIGEIEVAVEEGDIDAVEERLSDAYSDPKGNDEKALLRMLQFQLLRQRSIHVLSQIDEITVEPGGREGRAVVMAAAGSAPMAGLEALANVRADIFELRMTLTKPDDDWQIVSVIWKRAGAGDFLE